MTVSTDMTETADAAMAAGAMLRVRMVSEATGGVIIPPSGGVYPYLSDNLYSVGIGTGSADGAGWYTRTGLRAGGGWRLFTYDGSNAFMDYRYHLLPNGSVMETLPAEATTTVTLLARHEPAYYKDVIRKAGADRYLTALELAKEGFAPWGNTDLVVACGEDRCLVDALSASGLAGACDAPLLLVKSGSIAPAVKDAISAMPAGLRVHVVGGTPSVSAAVASEIAAIPSVGSVDRCFGPDRYQTAAQAARWVRAKVAVSTALIANGEQASHFFDALALSPVAFEKAFPVLLTKQGSAPATTTAVMAELGLTERYRHAVRV